MPQDDESTTDPDEFGGNGPLGLAEELGVIDVTEVLFLGLGKLFSAAGPDSPIAQITEECLLLHPPQLPLDEDSPTEEVRYGVDDRGVLLDELGQPRRVVGAKYKGNPIYVLAERKPGTTRPYVGWFTKDGEVHKFTIQGETLTVDMLYRIRTRTHDGEISVFPEVRTTGVAEEPRPEEPEDATIIGADAESAQAQTDGNDAQTDAESAEETNDESERQDEDESEENDEDESEDADEDTSQDADDDESEERDEGADEDESEQRDEDASQDADEDQSRD